MLDAPRGIPYMVGSGTEDLDLEIKNTFLNFPGRLFAPTSSERRASSCPLLSSSMGDADDARAVARVDVLALTKDQNCQEAASPGSTGCSSSWGSSWDSAADSPIGQWADHDCSQNLISSVGPSLGAIVLDNAVEKGAYITGEGDHRQWHEDGVKGSQIKFSRNSCLVLRGLPFSATECDLACFLEHCGVLGNLAPGRPIRLLLNPQGRLSGFAEVNMVGATEAVEARSAIHLQRLGTRYIEVLPPGPPKLPNGGGSPKSFVGGGNGGAGSPTANLARHGGGNRISRENSGRRAGWGGGGHFSDGQAAWSGNWRREIRTSPP